MQPEEAEAWVALRAALWPDEPVDALRADVMTFFSVLHGGQPDPTLEAVLAAVDTASAEVVGFAELSRRVYAEGCDTSPVGYLEGWYVSAKRRRQGVGAALIAAAENWARSLGCAEFASDALAENNLSATAHKALGFEEVDTIRCFRKDLRARSGRG